MLCWDPQHAPQLVFQLTVDLFSTRTYRKIAEAAIEHLNKYGTPPRAHLRDLLEDQLRRGEEGQLLRRILDAMDGLYAELQPDYVLSQLDRFIATRKLSNALSDAADALQQGDIDKAREAIYRQDLQQKPSPGIWLHDPEAMLSFLNVREDDFFPTGIEALDQRGVRPARKQLFIIIGSKGIGKSWWLTQIGKHCVMNRRSVLHLTLENSEELAAQRYTQALYAMSMQEASTIRVPVFKKDALGRCVSIEFDVRSPELLNSASRRAVSKKLLAMKSRARLLIKEFPTGDLTISQLNMYLDSLDRTENFRPDMLILDQAFNLRFDPRDIRTSMGQSLIHLRGTAIRRNMAIVTAWQGNRATDSAKTVTTGMVAEDWSLGGTADTICTISRTQSERDVNLARVLVDKARGARDKFVVMVSQSYDTGQFALDGVYTNKFVDDEVNRLAGEDE